MHKHEFIRISPESVGVSSSSISNLLDELESGFTEMHAIQIMRHGKICAEGWWNPFAPGIRHSLMSVSKTYTATAIGIAYTERMLMLTDRIIDILPDKKPANPGAMLQALTIRDLLCMSSGMEPPPEATQEWIRSYFSTPIIHRPGTRFMYDSVGSTLLGAIIQRLSGLSLHEYLTPRLFDRIGINAQNLRWGKMHDGTEAGGVGLFALAEDNLRLMKLYMDGGVWNGERILAKDYVSMATAKQIDTSALELTHPFAKDNFCGYGFKIWLCRPEGVYRADGAMGQYAIVCPKQDMIISILETGKGIEGPQKTLDAIWRFIEGIDDNDDCQTDAGTFLKLQKRLSSLALPRPDYSPHSKMAGFISQKRYAVKEGCLRLENQSLSLYCGLEASAGVERFCLSFNKDGCCFTIVREGIAQTLSIATDGSRALNKLELKNQVPTLVYLSGAWPNEQTFDLTLRWIETSFVKKISFRFTGNVCDISFSDPLMSFGLMGAMDEPRAKVFRI